MLELLRQYFNIAFLMGKPQDLPHGTNQLYVAIGLNFLTYIIASMGQFGLGKAAMHATLDIVITAAILYFSLMIVSKLGRFQQALGAICGAGAVLNCAAIPMLQLNQTPIDQEPDTIAVLSYFVLLVWGLSLFGHVLRHTFNIRMSTSIVAAVMYYLFIVNLFAVIFVDAAPIQAQ